MGHGTQQATNIQAGCFGAANVRMGCSSLPLQKFERTVENEVGTKIANPTKMRSRQVGASPATGTADALRLYLTPTATNNKLRHKQLRSILSWACVRQLIHFQPCLMETRTEHPLPTFERRMKSQVETDNATPAFRTLQVRQAAAPGTADSLRLYVTPTATNNKLRHKQLRFILSWATWRPGYGCNPFPSCLDGVKFENTVQVRRPGQ